MANTRVPITDNYPIQLHYIKALFLERQYRQCIQACRDLMKLADTTFDEPLQKTFVNSYLGLCHDEIARLMHHNSVAKLPAFSSAEQFYQDAIDALPTQQEVQYLCAHNATAEDSFPANSNETPSEVPDSPTISSYDPRDMGISRASSPILSSMPIIRQDNVASPVRSPGTVTSDWDDLESHDSFSELMTPNRVQRASSRMSSLGHPPKRLSRDLSRMSLLESRPSGLPRDVSRMSLLDQSLSSIPCEFSKISLHDPPAVQQHHPTSHGLMRPIRLGSPAKPCFLPPDQPYSGTGNVKSKLPQLVDRSNNTPNFSRPRIDSRLPSPEPDSPDPKLSSYGFYSDTSSGSFASPQTPRTPARRGKISPTTSTVREDMLDQDSYLRVTDHIAAMRAQLRRHLTLVGEAKDRLRQAQEERRAARLAPTKGTPLGTIDANRDAFSSPPAGPASGSKPSLPQARSYWSFVPEDVKASEMRRRIEAGKARDWKRERFQPGKYQELCEKALDEL